MWVGLILGRPWAGMFEARQCVFNVPWHGDVDCLFFVVPDYGEPDVSFARPRTPQDQPHPHVPPNYGTTRKYSKQQDNSPLLDKVGNKFVQEVCGTLLYYARAKDCTMLAALGSITTQQSSPTANTMRKIKQLIDYAATHPDTAVTYRSSNMVLVSHSDASYLSETKSRSRAGGHFFMSSDIAVPTL